MEVGPMRLSRRDAPSGTAVALPYRERPRQVVRERGRRPAVEAGGLPADAANGRREHAAGDAEEFGGQPVSRGRRGGPWPWP